MTEVGDLVWRRVGPGTVASCSEGSPQGERTETNDEGDKRLHENAILSAVQVPFPPLGPAAMVQSDVVHGCNVRRVC